MYADINTEDRGSVAFKLSPSELISHPKASMFISLSVIRITSTRPCKANLSPVLRDSEVEVDKDDDEVDRGKTDEDGLPTMAEDGKGELVLEGLLEEPSIKAEK